MAKDTSVPLCGVGPNRRGRDGYELAFEDNFAAPRLDPNKWHDFYLPHWSALERTRPRYAIINGHLELRIDPEQPPWCPEFDGAVIVSSLQTGQFSGPVGSALGQHRFREGLIVRDPQPLSKLYVPRYGYIEMRARADIGSENLVALFLVGFEDFPERSGEITVMEIFGDRAGPGGTALGHGIKKINDPHLRNDFADPVLPFSVADWHIYAAEWTPAGVDFYFDNQLVRRVSQAPDYEMFLLLNIYKLAGRQAGQRSTPPTFTIDYVRGYRPLRG